MVQNTIHALYLNRLQPFFNLPVNHQADSAAAEDSVQAEVAPVGVGRFKLYLRKMTQKLVNPCLDGLRQRL
jgi:hypothetical protein